MEATATHTTKGSTMKTNNLISLVMLNSAEPTPEVGMGATECKWTDRHACTIVEITHFKSGNRKGEVSSITVQQDTAIRTDGNGMSDSQTYTFVPNPLAFRETVKVNKDGSFGCFSVGHRSEHYDFSF